MHTEILDEAGSTIVECALLAPVVVGLLLWCVYLGDLGVARIRSQSVARFVAWELTAWPLSDPGGDHEARFREARATVLQEAERRFGDLDPSDIDDGPGVTLASEMALAGLSLAPIRAGEPEGVRPPAREGLEVALKVLGEIAGGIEALTRPALEAHGFDVGFGEAHVEVRVRVRNRLLPRSLLEDTWFTSPFFPESLDEVELAPARMSLRYDAWSVGDGSDVALGDESGPFFRQVNRIALLGLGDRLAREAGSAADWLPVRLSAQLASQNYLDPAADRSPVRCGGDRLARTGRWQNETDEMSPVRCFDTLPIDANGFGAGGGLKGDPNYVLLSRRGDHYMGCDRAQAAYPSGCGGVSR